MKVIIPAAGYATRLYPLTKDTPKALLDISGKTMLDHILDKLKDLPVREIIIVSNRKFVEAFRKWASEKSGTPITVLDDGTTSNEDRLGAVGDVQFGIDRAHVDEDLLMIAGDNLYSCNMKEVYTLFKTKNAPILGVFDVKTKEEAKKMGVIEINENYQIVECVEKPEEPKSTLIVTMVQFFPKDTIPMIKKYLDEGNKPDRMGDFITWLVHKEQVFAYFLDDWKDRTAI